MSGAKLWLAPGDAAPEGAARASGPAAFANEPIPPPATGCRVRIIVMARCEGVSDAPPEAIACCSFLLRAPATRSPGDLSPMISAMFAAAARPASDAPPPTAVTAATAVSPIPSVSAISFLLVKRFGIFIETFLQQPSLELNPLKYHTPSETKHRIFGRGKLTSRESGHAFRPA
jgi:hypothetical protein